MKISPSLALGLCCFLTKNKREMWKIWLKNKRTGLRTEKTGLRTENFVLMAGLIFPHSRPSATKTGFSTWLPVLGNLIHEKKFNQSSIICHRQPPFLNIPHGYAVLWFSFSENRRRLGIMLGKIFDFSSILLSPCTIFE